MTAVRIVELTPCETHELRRRVLRDGTESDVVEFEGDDEPTTWHLGVFAEPSRRAAVDVEVEASNAAGSGEASEPLVHATPGSRGELLAISTWIERPCGWRPGSRAMQLRGMAVDPDARGHRMGASLLSAGIERCVANGVEVVWARARDSALDFYVVHGFTTMGDGYIDAATGLPHHDIVCDLVHGDAAALPPTAS